MLKLSLIALVAALTASSASAALIYEGFNYNTGALIGDTNPSTGNSWLQAGTTTGPTAINVVSGSLTPPVPLQPAVGNSVAVNGSGNVSSAAERLALPSGVSSGTVYYSFEMQVTALTASNNTTGGFFFGLNNTGNSATTTNPTVAGARVQTRIDPNQSTQYDMGVFGTEGATAASSAWTGPLNVGDTIFLVGAYTFVSGVTNDINSMWINPDVSTFGSATAPAPTETDTNSGTDLATVASVLLRQSPAPFVTLDELRVGTSWADVTTVPEPASAGLLGIATMLIAARGRKQVA